MFFKSVSGQTSKLTSVLYHQLPVSDGMGKLEIIFKNKFPFVYLMGGPWNGLKYLSHGVQDGCYGNWQIQGDIEGTSSSRGVRRGPRGPPGGGGPVTDVIWPWVVWQFGRFPWQQKSVSLKHTPQLQATQVVKKRK